MGLRYTLGLQDPAAWGQEGVLAFEEVRGRLEGTAGREGVRGREEWGQKKAHFHFGSTSPPPPHIQADEEQAILHFYFAAKSGDNTARMALGYRHMHGIGVPKSCWTAATYYQPVAEQVWTKGAGGRCGEGAGVGGEGRDGNGVTHSHQSTSFQQYLTCPPYH